ncbi:phasin family protein [Geminocystis sp. CENA526]|uniref:phasin family protein n=1 Tax=Geminocystis sp. CENA526 TaxID=1355871 RepID=UPI003D6FFB20
MAESENLLQKAFYLGVGIASYAVEKANDKFQELKQQAEKIAFTPDFPQQLQKMADDMVNKGKMTAEEARTFVDEMLKQQNQNLKNDTPNQPSQPRPIEIITDEDDN